jgi:hypothetical protein
MEQETTTLQFIIELTNGNRIYSDRVTVEQIADGLCSENASEDARNQAVADFLRRLQRPKTLNQFCVMVDNRQAMFNTDNICFVAIKLNEEAIGCTRLT